MNIVAILKQLLNEFVSKSKDSSVQSSKEVKDLKLEIISLTKKAEEAVAKSDFLQERVKELETEMSEAEDLTNQLKEAMQKWVK